MQLVPLAQPAGQVNAPQVPVQVAMHEHESAQSRVPHALLPVQLTVHAASLHSMLSHALVPVHAIWHAVSPMPQSMLPQAFGALQVMAHDAASRQSIDEHAPPVGHRIAQA